jgi:hypothetical protein
MIGIYVALVGICSIFSIPLRFCLNKSIASVGASDSRLEQPEIYPSIPGFPLDVLKTTRRRAIYILATFFI